MTQVLKGNDTKALKERTEFLDLQHKNDQVKNLMHNAWTLSYCALWNTCLFSKKETRGARRFIYQFIAAAEDPYKAYLCYCQRILLVFNYLHREKGRYVPVPSIWFNDSNLNGFAGTEVWYEKLAVIRSSLPVYKIEMKAMAEAILEMREEPSQHNFIFWTNYFKEKNCPFMYELFLSTVVNGQYEDY